jgi:oxygen-independent coproporphyrinogen-3 oxidase
MSGLDREGLHLGPQTEVTIECNPESLTEEKVSGFKSAGINRISLGVQSFQDVQLRRLERLATRRHLQSSLEWIQKYFSNYSVDLMLGLPDQTEALFEMDLKEILQLNPPHLSAYVLTLSEDHVWKTAESMKSRMVGDDRVEKFYLQLISELRGRGFEQYEVSNFAKPGFQSVHNTNYWDVESSYLGLGPGAHGYLGKVRYESTRDPNDWMKSPHGIGSFEVLTREQQDLEKFYMELRTRKPAKIQDFRSAAIAALQQAGLIEIRPSEGVFTLTDRGWLLMESVAERLLPA